MGKCVKNIFLSLLAAVFSLLVISGPVFATTPYTLKTAASTSITTFATATPSPDNPDTPDNPDNPEEEQTTETPTCYDQVGGVGWLVCPGTGFLANVIDGAYDILENLIRVKPIPTDSESPIHVVWEYLRNITNVIFIIFLLVVIYSQLTGFGLNNYGIKRVLPRIIIAAILVNLSYIVCIFAVDLSNVIGGGLREALNNIQQAALTSGTVSDVAANASVAGIVATILGIGTVGTVTALTFAGGFTGLLWLLIPIVLSGAIAVLSAVITMAARQALIFLLVMISPLAFVAYLLPNTEKWFKRWYNLFFSMLIFYPMFALLYGGSRLAGLVIITSATNWLGVVLGIAVQVLPLFMSIPLMRMSNTMLGRIDGLVHRASMPIHGMATRRAIEGHALAKQRQLASNSYRPSTRLAQYLEQRRFNRKADMDEQIAEGHSKRMAGYANSYYNRNGQLSRRGLTHYSSMQRTMQYTNAVTRANIDFDEGFRDDGTDTRVHVNDLQRVQAINTALTREVDLGQILKSRQRSVDLENTRNRAQRIRDGARDERSEIHRQITSTFNLRNTGATEEETRAIQNSINATLSDAITDSRKVDAIAKNNYLELYDDMPAGPGIMHQLEEAFRTGDYNSAAAATLIMAKRGDHGDIIRTFVNHSNEIANDFAMQKNLADTGLSLKSENIYMWAWAKANMIRRSMSATNDGVTPYIDMQTFLSGNNPTTDSNDPETIASLKKASLQQIFSDLNSWSALATQDRTTYKEMLKLIQDGTIPMQARDGAEVFPLLFPEKYIRSAAVSGLMDGEQLAMLNNVLTGGYKVGVDRDHQSEFFLAHQDAIHNQLMSYVNNMVANQLVSSKSSTITSINEALLAINPDDYVVKMVDGREKHVSRELYEAFANEREALNKPSAINQRNSMNKSIREMFDIDL